ncbi:MAG: DJ-1/PfpI family protein [Archangium sp.]|nr:DJ-1/PfpI family protein [Archangium sp.]
MDILMVVAQRDFRDEEFVEPRHALEAAGHHVIIGSVAVGPCTGTGGSTVRATVALADVRADRLDGVVFVGGPGARSLFDDAAAHRIAVEVSRAGKLLGAICVAPVILARAGVLVGRRATVFPSEAGSLTARHALLQHQDVVVDGKLVTASGPAHARAFGAALVQVLTLLTGRPQPVRREAPRPR